MSGKDNNSSQSFEFLKTEKNCWNCGGFGHVKDDCPSDKSVRRSKPACIKGLQILHDQEKVFFLREREDFALTEPVATASPRLDKYTKETGIDITK